MGGSLAVWAGGAGRGGAGSRSGAQGGGSRRGARWEKMAATEAAERVRRFPGPGGRRAWRCGTRRGEGAAAALPPDPGCGHFSALGFWFCFFFPPAPPRPPPPPPLIPSVRAAELRMTCASRCRGHCAAQLPKNCPEIRGCALVRGGAAHGDKRCPRVFHALRICIIDGRSSLRCVCRQRR